MGTPDLAVRRPPGHSTVLPFEERTWKATSTTTPTPALRPPRARAVEEAPGGPFFRKEVIIHLLSEFDSFECAKALAHCSLFATSTPTPQPYTYLPTPTYTHPHRETFDTTVPTPRHECMQAVVFALGPKPPLVTARRGPRPLTPSGQPPPRARGPRRSPARGRGVLPLRCAAPRRSCSCAPTTSSRRTVLRRNEAALAPLIRPPQHLEQPGAEAAERLNQHRDAAHAGLQRALVVAAHRGHPSTTTTCNQSRFLGS